MAVVEAPSATALRWRLNPACDLHWRHWDEGYVLFDAASGFTHVLNVIGASCLEHLALAAHDAFSLTDLIREELDLDQEGLTVGEVHTLLVRFETLGLAEAAVA